MASASVRGMVESGLIVVDEKGWKVDRTKWGNFNTSSKAADVLANQLNDLPGDTWDLLALAAVHGREFDLELLVQCAHSNAGLLDVETSLEIARNCKLIWRLPDGSYSFVHDKIREILLELIEASAKREMHLRIANYFTETRPHESQKIALSF